MSQPQEIVEALNDILTAGRKAQEFVGDIAYDEFVLDDKTSFAVVRAFEIVGEAAKRIPTDFRRAHSTIPGRELAGFRDKLIHDYARVSLLIVWNSVRDDLPEILPRIEQLILEATDKDSH